MFKSLQVWDTILNLTESWALFLFIHHETPYSTIHKPNQTNIRGTLKNQFCFILIDFKKFVS